MVDEKMEAEKVGHILKCIADDTFSLLVFKNYSECPLLPQIVLAYIIVCLEAV